MDDLDEQMTACEDRLGIALSEHDFDAIEIEVEVWRSLEASRAIEAPAFFAWVETSREVTGEVAFGPFRDPWCVSLCVREPSSSLRWPLAGR